jgi:DnaK suppressor protein
MKMLTDSERDVFRARLQSEKKHLQGHLKQLGADITAAEQNREGSLFGKREEGASEAQELEKRLSLENRTRERLAEIEQALAKIKDGSYGRCDICGQPIDRARLEALPQANRCLKCTDSKGRDGKTAVK